MVSRLFGARILNAGRRYYLDGIIPDHDPWPSAFGSLNASLETRQISLPVRPSDKSAGTH